MKTSDPFPTFQLSPSPETALVLLPGFRWSLSEGFPLPHSLASSLFKIVRLGFSQFGKNKFIIGRTISLPAIWHPASLRSVHRLIQRGEVRWCNFSEFLPPTKTDPSFEAQTSLQAFLKICRPRRFFHTLLPKEKSFPTDNAAAELSKASRASVATRCELNFSACVLTCSAVFSWYFDTFTWANRRLGPFLQV